MELVTKDHPLCKIEAAIDFSFILDQGAGLSCANNGNRPLDPVFNASTLSQNRCRRFNYTSVTQDIFDVIVEQAIGQGPGRWHGASYEFNPSDRQCQQKQV